MPRSVKNENRKVLESGETAMRAEDGARQQILLAGIEVFGSSGFDGATTRAIANRANVNLGLIQYYFGGKEGLYLACADAVADHLEPSFVVIEGEVKRTCAKLDGAVETVQFSAGILRIWMAVADVLLSDRGPRNWQMFVAREQMAPSLAAHIIQSRVMQRMLDLFAKPVAMTLKASNDSQQVQLSTFCLLSPIFLLQRTESLILSTLGWRPSEPNRRTQMLDFFGRQAVAGVLAIAQGESVGKRSRHP